MILRNRIAMLAIAVLLILWGPAQVLAEGHPFPGSDAVISSTHPGPDIGQDSEEQYDTATLRQGPGYQYGIVAPLHDGIAVRVIDGPVSDSDGADWYHVKTSEADGWVQSAFLTAAPREGDFATAPPGERVAAIARSAVGRPYRWGGMSPESGFDCTGFVLWVFSHLGINLPHNETGQLYAGPRVGADDLEMGDIVVFKNTYKAGPSHTGIYLGDGKFIHAVDTAAGVVISNLWDSYWSPRFVAGVRLSE